MLLVELNGFSSVLTNSYMTTSVRSKQRFCNFFWSPRSNFYGTVTAETEAPIKRHIFWATRNITQVSDLHQFLQLCARNRAAAGGKACHARMISIGLRPDTLTSNMLMNMYAKCGLLDCARRVFDEMPKRSLVSWNTLIGSYAKHEKVTEALWLFVFMLREGSALSEFTMSSVLCACAAKCALLECKQLHGFSIKAMVDSNSFVGTALLNVYARCGLVREATHVFDSMPERNVVTWTCMVAGYVQNELYEKALLFFRRAQEVEIKHNQFMFSSIVSACAGLAASIEGKQVHALMLKTGFYSNIYTAASLTDMYGKCGCIREAYIVFTDIEDKNVVSWNVMISGFAKHARAMEATILFEKMQQFGLCPNELTYISLLSACSHIGSVETAESYFSLMVEEHNLSPNVIHYSCMVDILGRAGKISEAFDLIRRMPFEATASIWGSLLACCRVYGNLELAEIAAKHLFDMEPDNAGNHILLANIYAANKRWDEVARSRKLLKETIVKRERGKSWIEIKNEVHTFTAGERNHPRINEIYKDLDSLVEKMNKFGYEFQTEHDHHDVKESEKQELLKHHSEKLALVYGLMSLPGSAPIRIMKNLRICGDCHTFVRLASSITGREIIVRDINRFHHFRNGSCSCNNFW